MGSIPSHPTTTAPKLYWLVPKWFKGMRCGRIIFHEFESHPANKGEKMKSDEFVTSDTHFFHTNIIKYSNRPFKDVDHMNEELIRRWNEKVPKTATVYHLGDFAFCSDRKMEWVIKQLNGNIVVLLGNHDHMKAHIRSLFHRVIPPYLETKTEDKRKVVMCHYPLMVWNKSHHGSWHLHGHCHGSLPDTGVTRIDVGVDTHPNYEPYSYAEIVEKMKGRSYQPVDHHDKHTNP